MTQTTNTQLDSLRTDDPERKAQQKLRLDFLNALHVAFKAVRFFPRQNESVIQKIDRLFELMQQLFGAEGACNIEHVHSFLMLNGSRLKTDVAGLVPYNFMMETMSKLKTGTISLEPTITFDDVRNFLYVFATIDPKDSGEDTFKMFEDGIQRQGLSCVSIEAEDEQSVATRNADLRRHSVDIYFRSISVAKSILQNAHAGKAVNFRKAKRAVQTMVDIAMKDEFFLLALSSIKNYDEYTYNHSTNIAVLSITFGQHLGLSKQMLSKLGMAALLHDIGKIDIDKEVLNKSGKLSRDEWEILKAHPLMGVKKLLKTGELNEILIRAITVAFQHHKRVDLQGYPQTKSTRELNLFSKIVAIADCYDALTTPRVYRSRSYSAAEALGIMLDDSGTMFDPLLLNRFAFFLSLYPVGTVLQVDTGEVALVYRVRHTLELLDRPMVKTLTDGAGNRIEPVTADLNDREADGKFKRNIVSVLPPAKYFKNLDEYFGML